MEDMLDWNHTLTNGILCQAILKLQLLKLKFVQAQLKYGENLSSKW